MSSIDHVHITKEAVAVEEFTPPHPARIETPEYKKAHEYLIDKLDKPCICCGVRKSTLGDPTQNPYHATQLESHHFPVERSLMDSCDPDKVHRDFPQVIDRTSLEAFVDSPNNLIIVCDVCHRSPEHGIHHLLPQDWFIQKYLYDGYRVVATEKDAAAAEQTDEQIEQAHGLEPAANEEHA